METQDCNSSDIRPEVEVGSANASNNFSPDLIEDFNDVPSNQDDFDQSTIDPSGRPSKKIRSKVWDHLIKMRAENLKDKKAQCKYCNAILGVDPAKAEVEVNNLKSQMVKLTSSRMQRHLDRLGSGNGFSNAHTLMLQGRHSQIKGVDNGLKSSFNSLFEQEGEKRTEGNFSSKGEVDGRESGERNHRKGKGKKSIRSSKLKHKNRDHNPLKPSFPTNKRVQVAQYPLPETPIQPRRAEPEKNKAIKSIPQSSAIQSECPTLEGERGPISFTILLVERGRRCGKFK
ncbi:hypothetical protein Ancab_019834 [Ancistrocladus abbreviatus]